MKQVSLELEALPFGGKTVVLGGDFRQVLPVVPNDSRGQIVAASLKTCPGPQIYACEPWGPHPK